MSSPPQPPGGSSGGRLVGSVVDPLAYDDDLPPLSGPSAPRSETPAPHPVRDRLLRRAREARGETPLSPSVGTPVSAPVESAPVVTPFPEASLREASAPSLSPSTAPPAVATGSLNASSIPPAEVPAPPPSSGGLAELDDGPGVPRSVLDSELDRVAHGDGGPRGPELGTRFSPTWIAIFGALLGLTTVGSLVALGSSLEEHDWRATAPTPSAPVAAASATPEAPPKPEREKLPSPWRVEDDQAKPGMRLISGKVGKKAFLTAIQDAGLKKSEAYRAYTALKGLTNLDQCSSSDEFKALIERGSGKLQAFEYIKSAEEIFQAKPGDDGYLTGAKLDLHVERNQIRRSFVHDGKSFETSAKAAGFDSGLARVLSSAVSGHFDLDELRAGDRMRIIAQEVTVLGQFSRYAGIEAIEVLRQDEKPLRLYYYNHAVEGGHYDDTGRAPYEGGWRKPIPGAPVTSKFNMKRMHPVLNKVMPHTGTDFGAPAGTPIGASSPGTVSYVGYAGPSGNLVKVKHAGGYETGYAHLSRFEKLKVGDRVKRLQTVGYCGSTGRSTGPHLHFTVKKDGKFIDPESLNLDGMRVLPPSHRAEFQEVKAKYDQLLDAIELPKAAPPPVEDEATPASPSAAEQAASGDDVPDPAAAEDESQGEDEGDATAEADEAHEAEGEAAMKDEPEEPSVSSPGTKGGGSSIFLSDAELLKMQGYSDDGEVSE